MPTLTTPPKLLNSAQEPANGSIVTRVTNQFLVGADLVVSSAALGQVVGGIILNAAGSGPFVIPATPTGYAVEIVLLLNEWRDGRLQSYPSRRTVSVPAGTTVTWTALVDVVPALPAGDYVVPPWAATLLTARDEAVAAAAAAETARAAAVVAKDAAVVAKNAAEAVGTTNDTIITALDGNAASAFRVQADARQSATLVPRWAATTAYAAGAKVVSPNGDIVSARTAHTSGSSYTTANWNLSATFVPRAANTVVIFGDSLTSQNGPGPGVLNSANPQDSQDSRGYWHWANAYMGQRATLVKNAGVGGNTTAQMLARIETDVIAYASDWVVFCGGANDVAQGRTLASIQADYTAILDRLAQAGRRVLVLNVPPSTSYNTGPIRDVHAKLNRWIESLPLTRTGVAVASIWRAVADLSTGSPATGMAADGIIHWSVAGAIRVGKVVADALGPLLAPRPNRTIGLLDSENIHGNPQFGAGTGWATLGAGVAATYTAMPDRWATEANLAITGVTDIAERGIQYIEPVANGRYAAGDIVQATARFKWSNAVSVAVAQGTFQPFLRIYPRLADNSFGLTCQSWAVAASNSIVNNGIPADGEIVAITTRLTLPATVANLYLAVGWQGMASGTVKVSDVAVWKNA